MLINAAIEVLPKGIKKLNLDRCNKLTDTSLKHLPQEIEELNLSLWCDKLTDAAIEALPKSIKKLNLSCSFQLTDELSFLMLFGKASMAASVSLSHHKDKFNS